MDAYHQWLLTPSILFGIYVLRKLVLWMMKKRVFSQTMPTIAVLLPPDSLIRKVWPKKWQTFHYDWYLHNKKTVYQRLGSDIFALVSLFGDDTVITRDPAAFVEVKITNSERFPRDLKQISVVCPLVMKLRLAWFIRWQSSDYRGSAMETSSKSYGKGIRPKKCTTRPCRDNQTNQADDWSMGKNQARW